MICMAALWRHPVAAETSAADNWLVLEPEQGGIDAGAGLERGSPVEEIVFGTQDPGEARRSWVSRPNAVAESLALRGSA